MHGSKAREALAHRGRWMLERERFRIADELPPAPDREAIPIGALVRTAFSRIQSRLKTAGRDDIAGKWGALAGNKIAAHTRPGPFAKGQLTVFVESNVWLHEFRRFHQARVEAALRNLLGSRYRGILPRLDPDGPTRYRQG